MTSPLSVDDSFTVGVSFDLLGGYLLGRGLLASPSQIARRASTTWGWNSADMIAQIQAGADGRVGLVSLAVGFLLQAGGYVALIAGASVQTGLATAGVAVVLAVLATVCWHWTLLRAHSRIVRGLVVAVARANPVSGELREAPDAGTLVALGQELGFFPTEAPGPGNPGALARYAQRYFGVDRVETHVPEQGLVRRRS
jgi:hypothetical protein